MGENIVVAPSGMETIGLSTINVISNEAPETRRDLQIIRNEKSSTSSATADEPAKPNNRPTIPVAAHHPASAADDTYHNNDSVLTTGSIDIQELSERPVASSSHPISIETDYKPVVHLSLLVNMELAAVRDGRCALHCRHFPRDVTANVCVCACA